MTFKVVKHAGEFGISLQWTDEDGLEGPPIWIPDEMIDEICETLKAAGSCTTLDATIEI